VELEKAKNEVQRKIGRNLLLFQQFEHLIKWFLANNKFEGYTSELISVKERQTEAVKKKMLGELISQYTKDVQPSSDSKIKERSEILEESYCKFSYWTSADPDYFESKEEALRSLASERNELVHHLLPRINPISIESWRETERYLDYQREKILPELNELQRKINAMEKALKECLVILTHQESYFISILCDIAAKASRNDGWTSLDTAGRFIRQQAPEEITNLKKKYGRKSLKDLILTTELFDISEEATEKGGVRAFYRLKY